MFITSKHLHYYCLTNVYITLVRYKEVGWVGYLADIF